MRIVLLEKELFEKKEDIAQLNSIIEEKQVCYIFY